MAKSRGESIAKIQEDLQALRKQVEDLQNTLQQFLDALKSQGVEGLLRSTKHTEGHPLDPHTKRLGIYVDVQNLYYAAKDLGGKIDYRKLRDWIVAGRTLVKANAYTIINPSIPGQEKFLRALENYGFFLRTKVIKIYFDGNHKGNWDLGMAVDMIEDAPHLDVVAIVTGDSDFAPVVRLLKRLGVSVEVYSFLHTLSQELREAADRFFPLSEAFLIKEREHEHQS